MGEHPYRGQGESPAGTDAFDAADQEAQTWEWVQQLVQVAAQTQGEITDYRALARLKSHDYSERLVQDPPRDATNRPQKAIPLLLADHVGDLYVTARHMAVFLRYDLGVEDAGSDDQIITRLSQVGGERVPVQVWDSTARDRRERDRRRGHRVEARRVRALKINSAGIRHSERRSTVPRCSASAPRSSSRANAIGRVLPRRSSARGWMAVLAPCT